MLALNQAMATPKYSKVIESQRTSKKVRAMGGTETVSNTEPRKTWNPPARPCPKGIVPGTGSRGGGGVLRLRAHMCSLSSRILAWADERGGPSTKAFLQALVPDSENRARLVPRCS